MEINQLTALDRIALCFSGGGFRASAYALGTLGYFKHLRFRGEPLLHCVEGLSTVSGGTLAGAAYAAQTSCGNSFEDFYRDFYRWMDSDILLDSALKKLASDEVWKATPKRRSLINAFALCYEEMITDATMADLGPHPHLKDICFNSTDFSFGLAFRFQTPPGEFGNYHLNSAPLRAVQDKVKVADAMAASSCFPLGFEPMIFPDDFFDDHKDEGYAKLKAEDNMRLGVGIMDGGIVDNQGVGSIMLADARRTKVDQQFDLIMICDVASYKMAPWEPAPDNVNGNNNTITGWWSRLTSRRMGMITTATLLLVSLGLLWAGLKAGIDPGRARLLFILSWISSVLTVCLFLFWLLFRMSLLGIGFAMRLLDWRILPGFMRGKLNYFSKLKFWLLTRMVKDRLSSGEKMINEIFLKQIRRLNYDLFYSKESLRHRRITSLIYELTFEDFEQKRSDEKNPQMMKEEDAILPTPSKALFAAAQIATETATTLWFTQEDRKVQRLKNLVACGQFTTCYNLLDYLIKLPEESRTPEVHEVMEQLRRDWKKFNEDPYWMMDELGNEPM